MKNSLLILISITLLSACNNKSYIITGTVDNKKLNTETVFIKERINRVWITIDSTIIQDGKFTFKGVADSTKIAYLVYEFPSDNKVRQAFVLENGKITANIDTSGFMTIKGTPQNDLLQNYQNKKNTFSKKAEILYKKENDNTLSIEQHSDFKLEIENINKQNVNNDKQFVSENANTVIGTHVFLNSYYGWNISEKEEIVTLFTKKTKEIERIKEIIADINIEKKLLIGNKYINFKLPSITKDSIALSDLVGKTDYLLIDFWASWCGPCIQSLPKLKTLYRKYKGSHFEIVGVSLDDDKNTWNDAVNTHKLDWKHMSDLKGWKCVGSKSYAVNSIPCTFLISKSGNIVGRNLSISEIEKLLHEKVAKN